jgi:hypothetical protein
MNICVRRREFIGVLGGILVASFDADAQPAQSPVVGFLSALPNQDTRAFRKSTSAGRGLVRNFDRWPKIWFDVRLP